MRALVMIVPLFALTLTGCGVLNPQPTTNPPAQDPGQAQPLPPQATNTIPPTDLPVIGTRTTSDKDIPLEISLREVRSGTGAMTVTFSATNRSTTGKAWDIWDFFSDGITQVEGDGDWTADGVAVIDTTAAKRYLPARSADHHCMCSQGLLDTTVGPDQTVYLSAVYQGLPPDVTTVSVEIPHAGVFGNVPVTR